jgi:hypothetical protein
LLDHLSKSSLEFRKGRGERCAAGIKYDIPPWIELGAVPPERLPQTPLDTVSVDASADGARYGESQSCERANIGGAVIC